MSPYLTQTARLEKIKENITQLTYEELATLCGVTKRTIRRDIEQWKQQGGYDEFLTEEFFKLYGIIKVKDPKYAFKRLCDLLSRRQDQLAPVIEQHEDGYILKWEKVETKNTTDKI